MYKKFSSSTWSHTLSLFSKWHRGKGIKSVTWGEGGSDNAILRFWLIPLFLLFLVFQNDTSTLFKNLVLVIIAQHKLVLCFKIKDFWFAFDTLCNFRISDSQNIQNLRLKSITKITFQSFKKIKVNCQISNEKITQSNNRTFTIQKVKSAFSNF